MAGNQDGKVVGGLGAGRILLDVMTDVASIFSVSKDWE